MLRFFAFLVLLCSSLLSAQTISFTFDDGLDPRSNRQATTLNSAILCALASADVKAMIFPAGKIIDSPEGIALVRAWGVAGHAIGNHTYSHFNYGSPQLSIERFSEDILREDALLGKLPGWTNRLRFPYLKEGETQAKYSAVCDWIAKHQYRPAPVSIDASDWYYSKRYVAWCSTHPDADPSPFRRAYLDHLWGRASYYDSLAVQILGRHPSHVILLHTNSINAAFISDVITMFRNRGWKVIAPDVAFLDPIFSMRLTTVPAGESVLWSLAKQNDIKNLRYPAENDEYERPGLDALGL